MQCPFYGSERSRCHFHPSAYRMPETHISAFCLSDSYRDCPELLDPERKKLLEQRLSAQSSPKLTPLDDFLEGAKDLAKHGLKPGSIFGPDPTY